MAKQNFFLFFLILVLGISTLSFAGEVGQVSGLPIPRFVSLKSSETNLRKGPNAKYPIVWTYTKKGYPMEIVAEFENWRKLRDVDGEEGWVHVNLINGIRHFIVNGTTYTTPESEYVELKRELVLFRYPDESSFPMARAELGVVGTIKTCNPEWCKVQIEETVGWARKENLWGVYAEEVIE